MEDIDYPDHVAGFIAATRRVADQVWAEFTVPAWSTTTVTVDFGPYVINADRRGEIERAAAQQGLTVTIQPQ